MEKPDYIIDDQERTWSNAFSLGTSSLILCGFPLLFFIGFLHSGSIASLITGIILLYGVYELTIFSFIRVFYLNGVLEFRKPLRKYCLLFRKKHQSLHIRPDEWTEVYRHSFKGGTAYYFRNGRTAAYFINADGLSNFYQYLDTLFPNRVKKTDDFPIGMRRKLRKVDPERVF